MIGKRQSKKLRRIPMLLGAVLCLVGLLLPTLGISAADSAVPVSVDAPATVGPGDYFYAYIDIGSVTDFDAADFKVVFNPAVLEIEDIIVPGDITEGQIDSTEIPVVQTNLIVAGTVKIVVNVPGTPGVTGSGYLCRIRFQAIGASGTSSAINLQDGTLSDKNANPIAATWTGTTVNIVEPDIAVYPPEVDFGDVTEDTCSATVAVYVTNNGSGSLVIGTITKSGSNANVFEIVSDNVSGQTLSFNESARLFVRFCPTSTGTRTAQLNIPSNDPDEATVVVLLEGNGTEPGDICDAIERGVEWLVDQQNGDGSWMCGQYSNYPVATTALVLVKLETHATDPVCGYGLSSPLDEDYPYHEAVQDGLDYLMDHAHERDIDSQWHGNPDTNGNGRGIEFYSPASGTSHGSYETGCVLMALVASMEPGIYGDTAQDVVDFLAWGQVDGGSGRGGWYYFAINNQNYSGDNSPSGWVVNGLQFAESPAFGFECEIPDFVKDELDMFVDYIQCDDSGDNHGGSGYTSPCSWVNLLKTGNLLTEMKFVGDSVDTPRVQDAIDYLVRHWDDENTDPGWMGSPGDNAHYQATFCIMKGLEGLGIEEIDGIDWFAEISAKLLSDQYGDGSFPNDNWGDDCRYRSTAWALLTLQKAVAEAGVCKAEFDVSVPRSGGVAPLFVEFTDESPGEVTKWRWDFGDGQKSTQQNPRHTFTMPGEYEVTLTVTGPAGSCEATKTINVYGAVVEKEEADLKVTNLFVSAEQIVPNQEIEIWVTVGNSGGTEGGRTVSLMLNGELEQSQSVTVSPGSAKNVVFRVSKAAAGTYLVNVGGKEGVFYVVAPAKVKYWPGPLDTPGIIVIIVVAIVLILALVFVLRKEKM